MMRNFRKRDACLFFLLLAAPALHSSDSAAVTYRRVFKSSSPEFIEIRVSEKNACTFEIRQLDENPSPQSFEVGELVRAKVFELTAQLNNFRGLELDVRRRIANLGEKTFRYERGGQVQEVRFNYTLNTAASQLMQLFEGLARQQEQLETLQRRMRYDRLGVNATLLQIESEMNRKTLPEPERLLPALEQIANDPRFVEIARQRARFLVERIRNPKQP